MSRACCVKWVSPRPRPVYGLRSCQGWRVAGRSITRAGSFWEPRHAEPRTRPAARFCAWLTSAGISPMATRSKPRLRTDRRADGRWKRRPPIVAVRPESIDAGAAFCLGDGRTSGVLAGRKDTTRKLYRDAYEAFRRFLTDMDIDPSVDGWQQ